MTEETSSQQKLEFQAEVKQLLDIVINSLYTDREIFLRELISNASDALEKLRYISITEKTDTDIPLEITINADESEKTITISDSGIGMTKDELVQNLGTIAHSGSKAFIKHLQESNSNDVNLIGQFGVGFYSAFMVADKVSVYTRSYKPQSSGWVWTSEGTGSYTILKDNQVSRGTKIVLTLKDDAHEFAKLENIKRIIKQYSGFVPFPIMLNGEKTNTLQAIWTKNKKEVKDEEYTEFYKYIANAYDEPLFHLHFTADAPLDIKALLYIPSMNIEQHGFGRFEPGVSLYCKKILIQHQSEHILPEWLRFIKGVIDSEELPLNISRETMQDSTLIAKLKKVITGRLLRFLNDQAENNKDKFKEFWENFSAFIKEGAATDFTHRNDLVKLMRFESSKSEPGQLISLKDYLEKTPEEQKVIYYVNGASREMIEAGPYLEAFRKQDIEVLYTHEAVDDYIFDQIGEFEGKKLVSIDQSDLELENITADSENMLTEDEAQALTGWLKASLENKVTEVKISKRLTDSPAMALNPAGMTNSMQRMMQMMNKDINQVSPKIFEINTAHSLIKRLNELRKNDPDFAKTAAEQIFENALISAGLIVDTRGMVERMYKILEKALG